MAWLIQRGNVYYVGWLPKGSKKAKYKSTDETDPAKAEIKKLEKELELKLGHGKAQEPAPSMSLEKLIALFESQFDVTPRTLQSNRYCWKKFMSLTGATTIADATSDEVVVTLRAQAAAQKVSPAYLSWIMRDTRKLLAYAVKKGLATQNPIIEAALPQQTEVFHVYTPEEERRYMELAPELLRRFVQVDLYTGVRVEQFVMLNWKQFNFTTMILTIPHQKRQPERKIPFANDLFSMIGQPQLTGLVNSEFEGKSVINGCDRLKGMHRRVIEKMQKEGSLTGRARLHDWKHTCASRLAHKLRPEEVRDFFKWSSIALVDRYVHTTTEQIRKALGR